ncbi:MAG TPA: VCBS repeat-containing protein, partial [Puia sp.]|nr:VCBS repeat-containing protein [Puia sp.]
SEPSYLLLNDGKGNFTIADDSIIALNETGIVTTAAFADVNQDGWDDLIIAGEWMGVKVFVNDKGIFKPTEIKESTGLWQKVLATDINGDGYPDILAGNWGHNSKLYAGKDGPLKLFVKDFDFNGSIEQIMTYTINGNEYPFLGKDQLELSLPALKHEHLSYDEVAGKTVQYLFGDLLKESRELKAETLTSSCFMNDGKGNFTRIDLPEALQLSPIFSFAPFPYGNRKTFFAAGNFYGVLPYEGRYDAMDPTLFVFDKNAGHFNFLSELPTIDGQCRDAKWIHYAGGTDVLVIARNNNELIFLKPNF